MKLIEASKGKPFFLACGFFRPHTPYVAPKGYYADYPTTRLRCPKCPTATWRRVRPRHSGVPMKEQETLTDDLRKQAIQAYLASTAHMDTQVGTVLAALEKQKFADNTIVVFIKRPRLTTWANTDCGRR